MALFRIVLLLVALAPFHAYAEESLTIAVASNFRATAQEIATEFTRETGIPVRLSGGSTGKLYAQIVNGAPYDIFLAADITRPKLLEDNGVAVSGSRMTYAIGSLVLWSADKSLTGDNCRAALENGTYKHLAIANPMIAPYGAAAREFLQSAGLLQDASTRMVYGENISQTLLFVVTGNATLGLVAASQVKGELPLSASCSWSVPRSTHSALDQQAVILTRTGNAESAQRFMRFLQTPQTAGILGSRGYTVPE